MTEFGPDHPIRIVALEQTCIACPSQWEGESAEGAAVYIRYRHGHLSVRVGPSIDEAIDRGGVFDWESDDEMDGWMDEDELRSHLPGWITLAGGRNDDGAKPRGIYG